MLDCLELVSAVALRVISHLPLVKLVTVSAMSYADSLEQYPLPAGYIIARDLCGGVGDEVLDASSIP